MLFRFGWLQFCYGVSTTVAISDEMAEQLHASSDQSTTLHSDKTIPQKHAGNVS